MQENTAPEGRPTEDLGASEHARLRDRLAADIAAGRTIALSREEMADPELRDELPRLLEELGSVRGPAPNGLRVADYTVLGEIGAGGMSTVYLARHDQLGRHVALKIVQPTAGGQQRARSRLLKEARAMAKLSHPHIVTIYDVVEAGDIIAIAMEWVDGLTLSGILRALPQAAGERDIELVRTALGTPIGKGDQLESTVVRTFVRMVHDVARAAACAHAAGLLHLDIKPSNVLVRRCGTALLADFGLVREIDLSHTHTQSFAGTPIYAAPEQLRRDDGSFGAATDVYALGMTLYELLARSQPLRHEGLTEMLRRVEAGRVPKLSTRVQVAQDLENIVHKAIAVEPQNRYRSADDLADDLQAFLDGRPVAAKPAPAMQRLRRWMRAEPWKAALLAVVLVTVPILLALGTKLLLEMPRIEASHRRDLRAAAVGTAESYLQAFLMLQETNDQAITELRRARELDPDDQILIACLLTLLGQDRTSEAAAEIERLPRWARQCDSVAALGRRFAEGRTFFTEDEVTRLAASRNHLDLLILALDQVLSFADTLVEERLEVAQQALQALRERLLEQNPLALGLEAWVAARLGNGERMRSASNSLAGLWPDNPASCQWCMLATSLSDSDAAIAIGREFLATYPESFAIVVRTAGLLLTTNRPQEALSILQASRPDDAAGRQLHSLMIAGALLGLERREEALLEMAKVKNPLPEVRATWLKTLENIDPTAAKQRYMSLIGETDLSVSSFLQAIGFGNKTRDRELHDAAVLAAVAAHPDRATFRWELAFMRSDQQDWAGTSAAINGLVIARARMDLCGHVAANALCRTKEWERLLQICQRWDTQPHVDVGRATYYLAIAQSRTGAYRDAFTAFERNQAVPSGGNAEAMFETAWLQVVPNGDPGLRDPATALRVIESPRARMLMKRMPCAWFHAIAAEIYFANDKPGRAIEEAEHAQQLLDRPYSTAPADLDGLLERALARYR